MTVRLGEPRRNAAARNWSGGLRLRVLRLRLGKRDTQRGKNWGVEMDASNLAADKSGRAITGCVPLNWSFPFELARRVVVPYNKWPPTGENAGNFGCLRSRVIQWDAKALLRRNDGYSSYRDRRTIRRLFCTRHKAFLNAGGGHSATDVESCTERRTRNESLPTTQFPGIGWSLRSVRQ